MTCKPILKSLPKCFALCCIIVLIGGCEANRFQRCEKLYKMGRYAATIEIIDEYITSSGNGAFITRAELLRSQCYYQLGLISLERQSPDYAIKFFLLANSEQADVELAKIYRSKAEEAYLAKNYPQSLEYIRLILEEIPESELVPEMLYKRIQLSIDILGDKVTAWHDYMRLYDNYPNNSFEILARTYVSNFINENINDAIALSKKQYFDDALSALFEISKYPITDINKLNCIISEVYQAQAEVYVQDQDYLEADKYFKMSVQYNPSVKATIEKRLREVAYLYIQKGDTFLSVRDFTNALLYYNKTFDIVPDYDIGKKSIEKVKIIQENIRRAEQIAIEGDKEESAKRYSSALKLYQQALQLDNIQVYRDKIQIINNLIEADKNPVAFAQRIINQYRNGILNQRISDQKQQLYKKYNPSDIKDSGWRFLLSSGQNKYEARYDILTPNEAFLYVWQINLREKSITPLNKLAENIMK